MALPTPSVPVFLAGYGPQQSDMQSLWVTPASFFQQRTMFRATQSVSATTLPDSGAATTIAYDTVLEDPYDGWNPSTHEWLAPISGWYQVTVTVFVVSPGTTEEVLQAYVGGNTAGVVMSGIPATSTVLPSTSSGCSQASEYVYLTEGEDRVYGQGSLQNAGAALATSLTAGQASTIEITFITS